MGRWRVGIAAVLTAVSVAGCSGSNAFATGELGGNGGGGSVTQEGTIEGQVTADGFGIGAIPVVLVGQDSVQTNSQGVFRFEGLAASQYQVAVRVPLGFTLAPGQDATRTVDVGAGGTSTLTFDLDRTTTTP